MIKNSLIDVWLEMNMEKREYTWFRRNPIKKARLDYFLFRKVFLLRLMKVVYIQATELTIQ